MRYYRVIRWLLLMGTAALLAGCTGLTPDEQRSESFDLQFPPAEPTHFNAPEMY